MTNGLRKNVALADRRRRVARLYLSKITQEEIAAQLGVDQAQISRDLAYLRKEWAAVSITDTNTVRGQELAELRDMERDCAVNFLQSKEVKWLQERRRIKERVAKMIGLDAPTQVQVQSWQDEIIAMLKDGRLTPADVRAEFPDLGPEFFAKAGVKVEPGE